MTTHSRRRFFRYSLRTLMLVVTVFCVWLGWQVQKARNQQYVISIVVAENGLIAYQHGLIEYQGGTDRMRKLSKDGPPGSTWLRRLIGNEYFFRVSRVEVHGERIDDTFLAAIKRLADIRGLSVGGPSLTDEGVKHISKMNRLEALNVSGRRVTDQGLLYLKDLKSLGHLGLVNTRITDKGLVHLRSFRVLTTLNLNGTPVTDKGLKHIEPLTNLLMLDLGNTRCSQEGIQQLNQTLPNCHVLYTPSPTTATQQP